MGKRLDEAVGVYGDVDDGCGWDGKEDDVGYRIELTNATLLPRTNTRQPYLFVHLTLAGTTSHTLTIFCKEGDVNLTPREI